MKWWEECLFYKLKGYSDFHNFVFSMQCSEKIESFKDLREDEFARYAVFNTAKGNTANLDSVLKYKNTEWIDSIIDGLIECAIDKEQHECYVMLLEYKQKHDLYKEKNLYL